MTELFDPNAGAANAPDLMKQMLAAKRQRLLADYLRKQTSETQALQGQMVSGRYVAPSIFQHLNNAFQQYSSGRAENDARTSEDAFTTATGQAQQAWQSSLPSATAASTKPYMAPGIDGEENIPGTSTAVSAQQPSRESVLKAAMAGLRIPGNEKATELWTQGMGKDLEREDTQTFRRETREDTQTARRDQQMAQERAASALQAERLAQQAADAKLRSEDRRYDADQRRASRLEAARLAAEIKLAVANSKPGKPIPSSVHKELSALETDVSNIYGLASTFKPEYSGFEATVRNTVAPYDPTGTVDTSGSEWWKNYAKSASLVQRHALFGATLNANEKASWAAADINQSMQPEMIERNLVTRERIAKKLFANAVSRYEAGGYANIRDVFDAEVPRETVNVESDKPGRPPAAAPVRKTIGGTTYEQRDGKWYKL